MVDLYENRVGPRNGARVVARAWVDPAYKKRLLDETTGTQAIAELGYSGGQGEYMVVLENTPKVHNLVVCTLCSCYPWPTLGLPPAWYKSAPYRSRAVHRSARGSEGVRPRAPGRRRGSRLGQHGGDPISRAAGASGWHRAHDRGGARCARDARFDGRRRQGHAAAAEAAHERHPRYGRHARHGTDRVREERARIPRAMGRARMGLRARRILAEGPMRQPAATISNGCRPPITCACRTTSAGS